MSSNSSGVVASNWTEQALCPPWVGGATLLVVAYSAVMALGLLGNAGLVLVIARQREPRNVTNVLIANLSCSDLLMCVVCLPATVVYTLMDHWVLGEALCKVTPFVQCTSVTVSIFSMVLISLERHQLVLHPTGWTPAAGHSYLAVGLTWLLACLISLPFLSFNILTASPLRNASLPNASLRNASPPTNPFRDHLICMELWPNEHHRLAYTTSLLVFQYCLPLVLVLVCYLRIFMRLRRRRVMLEGGRPSPGSRRINATLAAIVLAFAACWLPLTVFNALLDWSPRALPACQHDAVFSACHLAAMASTCANPLLYGGLNGSLRKELLAAAQLCRRRRAAAAAPSRYQSFPLSIVGSEGGTKATSLHRIGSLPGSPESPAPDAVGAGSVPG